MKSFYPLVDLFAGPGGLGEGFSSVQRRRKPGFKSVAAVEHDKHAHSTLLLRHFFRSFAPAEVPEDYYRYLGGELSREELEAGFPRQWEDARNSALKLTLGKQDHPEITKRIKSRLKGHKKWALVGGPPCQAYSVVGRSRRARDLDFEKDEKHYLYKEYLKIISEHKPPVFVMENVRGLLSTTINGKPVIKKILTGLRNPQKVVKGRNKGPTYSLYSLTEKGALHKEDSSDAFIVKAEEFGVPQTRHRMFIIGVRADINIQPEPLSKSDAEAPSVQQVIGNMPRIRSGISKAVDSFDNWAAAVSDYRSQNWFRKNRAKYSRTLDGVNGSDPFPKYRSSRRARTLRALENWFVDERLSSVTGHEARSHMESDLHRYFFAALHAKSSGNSPRLTDFPDELLPDHKNVKKDRREEKFLDRFRVQLPDKEATTITSHISKDGHYFIHYDPWQCRSLTVREAARLQTFPDNYHFEGPRTAQYHQVGNAVPPYLAQQIGRVVADILDRIKE